LVHTCYIKVQSSPDLHCFPQTQYVKPSAQIHMYSAEYVFELLNSNDKELMLDNLVEIWKQSTLEEAEEPEPKLRDRIIMVSALNEGFGLTGIGIKEFDDIDSNEQQAAKSLGIHVLPPVVQFDTGDNNQRKFLLPKLSSVCHFMFLSVFYSSEYPLFLG